MADTQSFVISSWGNSIKNQLGYTVTQPNGAGIVTTPDKKGTFIEIACGENHTIFRLENS